MSLKPVSYFVPSPNRSIHKLSRNRHPVKVLQFGNGNFLRGFADWMIQVANEKAGFNAGISVVNGSVGSGVLTSTETAYTVILRGIREEEFISQHYKIDVINRVVDPHDDFESFLDEALNAELQFIISNVQDTGNFFSPKDAAVSKVASTFPGKLTQLLFNRFKNKLDNSILILPTESHVQNGTQLKHEVQKYCTHWKLPVEFTTWLNVHITFCNTLVDRVVSGFPKKQKEISLTDTISSDELIVEGEWFHQWVIEGPRWIEEVLPLKKAGLNVIYTDNLAPFHFRKLRILTAVKSILACAGTLAGLQSVRDAIEHRVLGRYVKRLIYDEILPVIPGEIRALERYAEEVIDRLRNPAMDQQLDSLVKNLLPEFNAAVLPTMIAHVEKNGVVPSRLAYAMATLIYFFHSPLAGKESGEFAEFLKSTWKPEVNSQHDLFEMSRKVLSKWWEGSFKNAPQFAEQVGQHLYSIAQLGIIESLKK